MNTKIINVVIADSQYLIRVGLKKVFEGHSRIAVSDEASKTDELLDSVQKYRPHVVIFDYDKPSHFKIEDIKQVKSLSPDTNFLIISSDNDKDRIFEVLQSGGLSFLTKECDEEEIIGAVIATAKGEKFLCNKVIDIILEKTIPIDSTTCAPSSLTARELEVVTLTAKGLSARKIAEALYLSTHTVYTHRKNIMRKLGVNSASSLIIYAINNGLYKPDSPNLA